MTITTATRVGRPMKLPENYLEQVTIRHLQQILAEATAGYWRRRAEVLEDARPRPGEFHGEATREQLNERWRRLTLAAEQCRVHADLFTHDDIDADLIAEVLGYDLAANVVDVEELAA